MILLIMAGLSWQGVFYLFYFCIFLHCQYTEYQMWILGWNVVSTYHVFYLGSELSPSLEKKESSVVKTGHPFNTAIKLNIRPSVHSQNVSDSIASMVMERYLIHSSCSKESTWQIGKIGMWKYNAKCPQNGVPNMSMGGYFHPHTFVKCSREFLTYDFM